MMTTTTNLVVGVFKDRANAQDAIRDLRQLGIPEEHIGVIGPGDDGTGTKVEEGAGIGAMAGAGTGALWALGIAAGVLPAIGPVVAGGLLGSLLASAAGAAAVGGVVGALVGLGIPEDEAHFYEGELTSGRTVVTVRDEYHQGEAERILRRHGAYDRSSWQAPAVPPMTLP